MKHSANLSYPSRSAARRVPLSVLVLIASLVASFLQPTFAAEETDSEVTFITIENRSGKDARVAIPGGKVVRVKNGVKSLRAELNVTKRNGVEVKAWWNLDPRQLCVIFVRYEGHVVIGGKKLIRCLGN